MKRRASSEFERRGTIVPTLAVFMVGLLGAVALAVDVGMIAVARTETQNAADAAAMTGARTLNGDTNNNYNSSYVTPNARAAAANNTIRGQSVNSDQVTLTLGSYNYDRTANRFVPNVPLQANKTPNLVEARVTYTGQNFFAKIFGRNTFSSSGTARAVHRPRDVAVIVDMSGSMRFDSLLGVDYYNPRTESRNPETVYPNFGHYSSFASKLYTTAANSTINDNTYGQANITVSTPSGPPIVDDYFRNNKGASPVAAFSPAPDSYANSPAGDDYLNKKNSTITGKTVKEITGSTSTTFNGYTANPYSGYSGSTVPEFKGYTQGPRYWGKSFFIWPPDPRSSNDWRTKFFENWGTSTGVTDNTRLWTSSGVWQAPGSSRYEINYTAILAWIKQTPNPFPTQLRAGRILYYDSIPTSISTSYPPSDSNQRFWKEYIDYVIGVRQTSSSGWTTTYDDTGYGNDVTWGTIKISTKPSGSGISSYMNYDDNPRRPLTHFWFGPMTMLDFIANYNLSSSSGVEFYDPGTAHVAPLWACKLGVQAAMTDIKNNHPNDHVSLIFFSAPKNSSSGTGYYNRVRQPLGQDYNRLIDSLWFPLATIDNPGTEVRPFSSDNLDVPRANGGTSPAMGLMLAYNQFSGNTDLQTYAPSPAPLGDAGGLGRRGRQKLVILETDGMANVAANASFSNVGATNSYYKVRAPYEYPSSSGSVTSQVLDIANRICALETDSSPGYSTARKPVLIHTLAFGSLFDGSSSNSQKGSALSLLQNIQAIGSTQASAGESLSSNKIITGTSSQRVEKLRQAFSAIMQDGVQISLIQ